MRLHDNAVGHQQCVISDDSVGLFAERIGFADDDKALRLKGLLTSSRRAPHRERFVTEIDSIEADGTAEVYDAQIPGINAFDANGLYVHNCGEQPLPPYGACLLGSINLATLVKEPFTPQARLDHEALERLVPLAVRMLDNVVDVSRFPLPQQDKEAKAKRRIGLGVTGLADALIFCGIRYGSPEAVELTRDWLGAVQNLSYLASADIAAEKGSFPLYDRARYLAGETVSALPEDVRGAIGRYGIRNALLNSIAPTGTISLLADNVSSGIEPVFAFSYVRHVLQPDGSKREEPVEDHAFRLWRALKGDERAAGRYLRRRPDAGAGRSPGDAGGGAGLCRQLDLQDHQPAARHLLRGLQGHLRAGLCDGLQGLHDLPAERRHRRGAGGEAGRAGAVVPALAPAAREGRRRLYRPAARPAGGPAGPDLQDQMAGQRPRDLHHHQRRRCRTAAAGRSRSSSTPRTWSTTPGPWR